MTKKVSDTVESDDSVKLEPKQKTEFSKAQIDKVAKIVQDRIIQEFVNNPAIIIEAYDKSKTILRDWDVTAAESGVGISGFCRKNIFGEAVVILQKSSPRWIIQINGEQPHALLKSLDPIFSSISVEKKIKDLVDDYLTEQGFVLLKTESK